MSLHSQPKDEISAIDRSRVVVRSDKKLLEDASKGLLLTMKGNRGLAALRLKSKARAVPSDSLGWYSILGSLGTGQPRLEIWLDYFTNNDERHFWYGFHATRRQSLTRLTRHAPEELKPSPKMKFKYEDLTENRTTLSEPFKPSQFGKTAKEEYGEGYFFFGIFDSASPSHSSVSGIVRRAGRFFIDVTNSLPGLVSEAQGRNTYPQFENRRVVRTHLARERRSSLSEERKRIDNYRCKICNRSPEEEYGDIGWRVAEAHHIVPLSSLKGRVLTSIDDLITVCSNCHRMLHRMMGRKEDVAALKAMRRKAQKRRLEGRLAPTP